MDVMGCRVRWMFKTRGGRPQKDGNESEVEKENVM